MKVTELKNEGLNRSYKIIIPSKQIHEAIDKRMNEVAATAKIDGFRPGKVPLTIVKKRYGAQIHGEVIEKQVSECMRKLLKDKKLRPAVQPKVDFEGKPLDEKDVKFTLNLEVMPEIKIDDLELSLQNSKVSANKDTRILWNGPSTWLVVSKKEDIIKIINKNCNNENFAITDISHSRAVIQIKGFQAKEILKKGCPINFNEIKTNNCAGSVFHGITIVVDCVNNNPDTFNLLALRSFGETFYHHITDAALEFGYTGV